MRTVLADHDIEGLAELLWGILAQEGWLTLIPLELLYFQRVGLPIDSQDREIWRFAQTHHLVLLIANRNMEGEHSLEQTLRDESKEDIVGFNYQ